MNRHLLVGLIGALFVGAQDSPEKVELTLTEKGHTLTVIGVCTAEEQVSCWSPDGTADSTLTEQVRRGLSKLNNNNGQIGVKLGEKPRLVILETTSGNTVEYFSYDFHRAPVRDSYVWNQTLRHETVQEGDERSSTAINAIGLSFPVDAKTGSVFLRTAVQFLGTLRLEPDLGSTIVVGSHTLTLKSIKPIAEQEGRKQWELSLAITGPSPTPSFQIYAEDKDHKYIRYVDRTGKPVKEEAFRADQQKPAKQRKSWEVAMYTSGVKNGLMTVVSTIDPKVIGGFGAQGNVDRWIEITGFVLDPKADRKK